MRAADRARIRLTLLGLVLIGALALAAPAAALADFGPPAAIGQDGEASGDLNNPSAMATAPDGDVYVADENNRVSVFDAEGVFRFAFGKGVNAGPGDPDVCTADCTFGKGFSQEAGSLYTPTGIALDAAGNVYVSDNLQNRVNVFSPAGAFLYAFGSGVNAEAGAANPNLCTAASGCQEGSTFSSDSMGHPNGIEIDPASGRAYLPSGFEARVGIWTTAGAFVGGFGWNVNNGAGNPNICAAGNCRNGGSGQAAEQLNQATDVALLPGDRLAIADQSNRRVDVYTRAGAWIEAWGRNVNAGGGDQDACTTECERGEATGAGAIEVPQAVAADPSGNVFVVDFGQNRVSEFSAAGAFVRSFGLGVVDGTRAFQVCTALTGCGKGLRGTEPGAISSPSAGAVSGGDLLVAERGLGSAASRVEVFGEPKPVTPVGPGTGGGEGGGGTGSGGSGAGAGGPGGSSTAPPAAAKPTNRFRFGGLRLNLERGTAVLSVRVPGPGSLSLRGKGIRRAKATARAAGLVKLNVALVGAARQTLLREAKSKVTARVTFTPAGGDPLTQRRTLTLKAALGR
jgi:hypothetical protein